jgi:archaemetzincin
MTKAFSPLLLLTGLLIVITIFIASSSSQVPSGKQSSASSQPKTSASESKVSPPNEQSAYRTMISKLKPIHTVKAKPQSGDWLDQHKEPGQTFSQYVAVKPDRPKDVKRTTIYIQPLGTFNVTEQKLLDATVDLLGRYYHVLVKPLDSISLDAIPKEARRINPITQNEQILSTYILEKVLPPRRPDDAIAVLALITTDLWPGEGWNFVFGQASLTERVGVWSSARYGNPDVSDETYQKCKLRMLKVAIHETGHMFGMQHCTAYECGMNGSNHLQEADRNSLCFCPECSAKVLWARQAKSEEWYERLCNFAKKHQLAEAEAIWERCKAALKK